jgi:hypothetical protein
MLEGRILEVTIPSPERQLGAIRGLAGVEEAVLQGGRIRMRLAADAGESVLRRLREVLPRRDETSAVRRVVPTLEDVFRLLLRADSVGGAG